jgi:lipopolysaccharide transport system permease protein
MAALDISRRIGGHSILGQLWRQIWLQRQLFLKLLLRDFAERYRGSFLGLTWSLLLPLLSLLVFTFFFGVIFKMRWAGANEGSLTDLGLILFVGITLYNFLAECLNRAPSLILGHQNYVKNVIFPLEMLPAVMVASAVLTMAATLLVIVLLQATIGSGLNWTVLLLPIIVLPLVLFALGLSWFLSSLGVFVRDTQQVMMPVVQLLMFMSPVFYPLNHLPEFIRPWLQLNPLAWVIEQTRGVLLFGHSPVWTSYGLCLSASLAIALLGAYWFARTRKGFADVL